MEPERLAKLILDAHIQQIPSLTCIPNFRIDLQLNYSGRMATDAYSYSYMDYRKRNHVNRHKVGAFDFKVFRLVDSTWRPMEHKRLIDEVGKVTTAASIEKIFLGEEPSQLNVVNNEALVLQEAQFAMLEQEINWGDQPFQTWSKFAPSRNKRPRDFVTAYFRRVFKEPDFMKEANIGRHGTLRPPDESEFRRYREPTTSRALPWLTGNLLVSFQQAAMSMVDNPYYESAYSSSQIT